MNFIKYLTWNIKKYKKLIFSIFISILIGFIFSGCEVEAVETENFISLESSYNSQSKSIDFYNKLLNDYYGRTDINLSEFANFSLISDILNPTNYNFVLYPINNNKMLISKGRKSDTTSLRIRYVTSGGVNHYRIAGSYDYIIDVNNKTIGSAGTEYQYSYLFLNSNQNEMNIPSDYYTTIECAKNLFFKYILYFNGKVTFHNTEEIVNKQYNHKKNYYEYTEDNKIVYCSGDLKLNENYFELIDFETNISDYSMYLLQYTVIPNEFGEYVLTNNYSWFEISKPSQGGISTWQISNISDIKSGDNVYSIGIGTSNTPDLIRSEWFDSDYNLSDFMSNNSFRLRYYVEDLPEFFIPTDTSGSGDAEIIPPSGDDTEIVGGIKGIWQAVLNLPKMILDGLVGLFVPSEGFFSSYFDELLTWFEERLGILSYPITFTVDVLNRILDLDFNEPVISWDDMYVPLFEDEVPLIPAGEINFKTLVESNETILNFYNTYLIIVDGLLVFMIIKLIQRKHDEIVGGASE